ncbi:hypothetical protein CHY_2059 [Carboxydothermus hydrogenoformans Z-2901]|uniref:Uncharacterized protein n=1 Tax=Carboxydothermus hydrogenoformans (strain ATCC BAA-161 / DSM 6008 / Z-2901) TaxID=246194 RepID=Q3AAF6_CARHZ|nr:hypothetical protein CHY_2059 [Carboxydothermus hydrogenoformans Z-2901]
MEEVSFLKKVVLALFSLCSVVFLVYFYFYVAVLLTVSAYYDALTLGDFNAVGRILFKNNQKERFNLEKKLTEAMSWDDSRYLSFAINEITFLEKGFNYPEVVVEITKKDVAGLRKYEERAVLARRGLGFTFSAITFSEDPLAKFRDHNPGENLNEVEKQVSDLNLYPENILMVIITDKYKHQQKLLPGKNEREIKLLVKGIREGTAAPSRYMESFNYVIKIKTKNARDETKEVEIKYSSDLNVCQVGGKLFKSAPALKLLIGNYQA